MNPICSKKVFLTKEEAFAFQKGMFPYLCTKCGNWHVSSGLRGKLNKVKQNCDPQAAQDWFKRRAKRAGKFNR